LILPISTAQDKGSGVRSIWWRLRQFVPNYYHTLSGIPAQSMSVGWVSKAMKRIEQETTNATSAKPQHAQTQI
jgi:hypothetical protein